MSSIDDRDKEIFPFPGKVKSSVWEFFGFFRNDEGVLDKSRAICKMCRKGTSYNGNTTNLRTHMIHHHKDLDIGAQNRLFENAPNALRCRLSNETLERLQVQNSLHGFDKYVSKDLNSSATVSQDASMGIVHPMTPSVDNTLYLQSSSSLNHNISLTRHNDNVMCRRLSMESDIKDEESLTLAVVDVVIHDLIPIETLDSPYFRKMLQAAGRGYSLPSSHVIGDMLNEQYHSTKMVVTEILSNALSQCLKVEIWKAVNNTYITISVQVLVHSWNIYCLVLNTVELSQTYSETDIKKALEDTMIDWKLPAKAIIVSNGVADITAAASQLLCPHVTALCSTIEQIANLCIHQSIVTELLQQLVSIVEYFHSNSIAAAVLQEKQQVLHLPQHPLQKCNLKQWSSVLDMLKCFLDQNSSIVAALNDEQIKDKATSVTFSTNILFTIQNVVGILEPLRVALKLVKEMNSPTASVILPVLKKLEIALKDSEVNSKVIADLKLKMKETLNEGYSQPITYEFLLVSSLLDPRYKDLKFVSDVDRILAFDLAKQALVEPMQSSTAQETDPMLDCIVKVEVNMDYECDFSPVECFSWKHGLEKRRHTEYISSSNATLSGKKNKKDVDIYPQSHSDAMNDWLADVVQEPKRPGEQEDPATVEITRYQSEVQILSTLSPVQWWKERRQLYPMLSCLARKYLCVSAVMGTRLEPKENWYQRQRACLPDNLVEQMVFLNANCN